MMDFFGPGVEAAERIGLYPRLADVAYHVEAAEYVDAAGRPTASLDYDQFARLAGGKVLSLLRPDMERAALAALRTCPRAGSGSATGRRYPGSGGRRRRPRRRRRSCRTDAHRGRPDRG